jgi:NAD-specific glutamate dehydrogenase
MEYNFSSISVDTIDSITKKVAKVCDNLQDDINNFIRVLNDQSVIKNQSEINTVISDLLSDAVKNTTIEFTQTMNKVQSALAQYL